MPNHIHLSEVADWGDFPAIATNGALSNMSYDHWTTFNRVHITSIAESGIPGAVIALRCDKCKTTTFIWDSFSVRPKDGDYFMVSLCEIPEHNLQWNYIPPPSIFGGAYAPGTDIKPFPISGSRE